MTSSLLPLDLQAHFAQVPNPRQFLEALRTPLQAFLGATVELAPIQESQQGLTWNLAGKTLSFEQGESAVFETNLLPEEQRSLLLIHAALVNPPPTGLEALDQASKDFYDLMLAIHYGQALSDPAIFFRNMAQWVRLGVVQNLVKPKIKQYFKEKILSETSINTSLLKEQVLYDLIDTAATLEYSFEDLVSTLIEAGQAPEKITQAALEAGYSSKKIVSALTSFLPEKQAEKSQAMQAIIQVVSRFYDQDSDLATLVAMYQAGVQAVSANRQPDPHLPYREFFPMGHNRCLIFKNQTRQENFGNFLGELDVSDPEKISAFENKMISLFSSLGLDPSFAKAAILYLPTYAYAESRFFKIMPTEEAGKIAPKEFPGVRRFLFEALNPQALRVTERVTYNYTDFESGQEAGIEIHFSYHIFQGPEKPEVTYDALPHVMRCSGDRSVLKRLISGNRAQLKADHRSSSSHMHASKSAQEVRIDNFLRTLIDDASGIWAVELIKSQAKKIFSTANEVTAKGLVLMLVALCQHLRKAGGDLEKKSRVEAAIHLVMQNADFLKKMKHLPEADWPRMTAALSDMSEVLGIHQLKAEHPLRTQLETQRVSENPAALYTSQASETQSQSMTNYPETPHAS